MSEGRGNANALAHGAYSENVIGRKARARKRTFLRQAGLKAADLDALGHSYLDLWCRATARVEAWDAASATPEHLLTAQNTALRALRALEQRLRELGLIARAGGQPGAKLAEYFASRNGGDS